MQGFDSFSKELKAGFGDIDSVRTTINKIRRLHRRTNVDAVCEWDRRGPGREDRRDQERERSEEEYCDRARREFNELGI